MQSSRRIRLTLKKPLTQVFAAAKPKFAN